MPCRIVSLLLVLLVVSCTKHTPSAPKVVSAEATAPAAVPAPPDAGGEEPTEEVLRTLAFSR